MKRTSLFLLILLSAFKAPVTQPSVPEKSWEQTTLDSMSLDEKIGQLFMVAAYSNKGAEHQATIEKLITQYHIGGLIFFQGDPHTQVTLTNRYQSISKTPLMIGIDAEWGLNMRLENTRKYPYQMTLGSLPDTELIYKMGVEVAKECKALGIHINFAPVADINNNPKNPIINFRSFGENREKVAKYALAYALGMQSENVLACAKHFPGHGDTDTDSHLGLPTLPYSKERLDSLELYPFQHLFSNGVHSTMVAHMQIPVLDKRRNRPSSVSKKVVQGLLKDSLGFRGLSFTDALNMKGVAKYFEPGTLELEAFLAGNDVLLFPENVPLAIKKIKLAIKKKQVSVQQLNTVVLNILSYKRWAGLADYEAAQSEPLDSILDGTRTLNLIEEIASKSICLVTHKDFLPLREHLKTIHIAIGTEESVIGKNIGIPTYYLPKTPNASQLAITRKNIASAEQVVFTLHKPKIWSTKQFGFSQSVFSLINGTKKSKLLIPFTNAYILKNFQNCENILLGYEDEVEFHKAVTDVLLGQAGTHGTLPVTVGKFKHGKGILLAGSENYLPSGRLENEGFKSDLADRIEPYLQELVAQRAAPGGQVLVARNGKVVYSRCFGHHTYEKKQQVNPNDLYDLASITKVVATTLSVMKLYEDGLLALDDPICKYLPDLKQCNKNDVKIRDILLHQARLKNWIPFYLQTLPNRDSFYSEDPNDGKSIPVTENLFTDSAVINHIYQEIKYSPLYPKKQYVYSDLGMILLKFAIENITNVPFEDYVQSNFYQPLGLSHTTYLPLEKFSQQQIAPTELDTVFRKQMIRGTVHDPASAMMGGVAGHAGVFSNAEELAVIFQMLLNGGIYKGIRYFEPETIAYFTKRQGYKSRRALGFDKKENNPRNRMNLIDEVSALAYGHTGFTGTCVWADPKYDLVYVFLSNRTFPDQENKTLIRGNYRTEIQRQVYNSMVR